MAAPSAIGPYRVLAPIARGGGGQVLRVADPRGGPDLALKLLAAPPGERTLRRFETEAAALARIAHPGVVAIRDRGELGGCPYLVMELVEGPSLQERLAQGGALPWRAAAALALELAEALVECHAQGVLHRDLKPDNVVLDPRGRARLVDFGLALDLDAAGTRLTRSGTFMGTPGYWAPEQAAGQVNACGPATDVYGLGAVLYAALTSFPPLQAGSLTEAIAQTLGRAPEPPRRLVPDVPEALERLCLRCLEKDPAARPASMQAVVQALRAVLRAPATGGRAPLLALGGVAASALVAGALWVALRPDAAPEVVPPPAPSPPSPPPAPAPEPIAALLEQEAYPEALERLDRALDADPEDVEARVQRGFVRRQLDDFEGALADVNQVLAAHPDHAEALYHRGATRRKLDAPRALEDLNRALALDPSLAGAYYHRGVLYREQRDYPRALRDLDEALRLEPDARHALYHRARVQEKLGNREAAVHDLDRALGEERLDRESLCLRGILLAELGRLDEGLVDLQRAVDLYPEDADAHFELGFLRYAAGDFPRAFPELQRGLELEPDHERAFEARDLLGE
ncbi:MAG: tetratricopeptide repeat protein [Planctomycetota bacterium]